MNKRIKKKIYKRYGMKSFRNYHEEVISRVAQKTIDTYVKNHANEDLGHCYGLITKSRDGKKIIRLQLLTNCFPSHMS